MEFYEFLSDEQVREIDSKIPKIERWINYSVLGIGICDIVNGTEINPALVCLEDARNRYSFVQTALFEGQAKMKWYLEIMQDAPNKDAAVACGKYYFDYVTLLLYAIAEDIADFLIKYYNIDITNFKKRPEIKTILERDNRTSKAGTVGLYLQKEMGNEKISKIISTLITNRSWHYAIEYRNDWVHKKPPIISELGDELPRDMYREETDANGNKRYTVLAGIPKYSINELLQIIINASRALTIALCEIAEMVVSDNP